MRALSRREAAFPPSLVLSLFLSLLVTLSVPRASMGEEKPKRRPSPCRVLHPSDNTVEWQCRRLGKGETIEKAFGDRWIDVARFNRIDRRHTWPGFPLKVPLDLEEIADFTPMPAEYPPAAEEEKFILIDLSEQFLGAYEFGSLVFSAPVATGDRANRTPAGDFRVTAYHRHHPSSLYTIDKSDTPYPMTFALRFWVDRAGVAYWIHGRDLPGYPGSHGCIGLYDEAMQKKHYGIPREPVLDDAKTLFEWAIAPRVDDGRYRLLDAGPRVRIVGEAP